MASGVMQEVFVSPAVLEEVKRIIEDSEVGLSLAFFTNNGLLWLFLRFLPRFFAHQSVFCAHLQERTAYKKEEKHGCIHRFVLSACFQRRY